MANKQIRLEGKRTLAVFSYPSVPCVGILKSNLLFDIFSLRFWFFLWWDLSPVEGTVAKNFVAFTKVSSLLRCCVFWLWPEGDILVCRFKYTHDKYHSPFRWSNITCYDGMKVFFCFANVEIPRRSAKKIKIHFYQFQKILKNHVCWLWKFFRTPNEG